MLEVPVQVPGLAVRLSAFMVCCTQAAAALGLAWGAAGCGAEETGTGPHTTGGADAGAGGSSLASGGASTGAGGTTGAGGSSSAGGAASTGGASTGGASTGGASSTGGVASLGGAPNVPCPPGLPGPELVGIPTPPGATVAGFCIDSTEVTRAQYVDFLAASPATSAQDAWCSWNTTYTPGSAWPPGAGDEALPVGVDWCDASAYCKWAGKRLCGKIGGGSSPQGDLADATKNEWFAACSAGGTRTFPYGDTYDAAACNGAEAPEATMWTAGSRATCEGGYPGLFDLSGNVGDWEDSCAAYTAADGETAGCLYRGGNRADSSAEGLACATRQAGARRLGSGYQGIRCCSSPL